MSNELVPSMPLAELGGMLVKSGFFADVRQESQAIVKVLAGRELGFGPIQSMTGIHIIKGKPTLGAGLIAAAIKRTDRYNYRVVKLDEKICEIEFFEKKDLRNRILREVRRPVEVGWNVVIHGRRRL